MSPVLSERFTNTMSTVRKSVGSLNAILLGITVVIPLCKLFTPADQLYCTFKS